MVHRDEQADLEGFLTFIRRGGTMDLQVTARRRDVGIKPAFDGTAIIVSLAAFTLGAFMIGASVFFWLARTEMGLLGLLPSIAIGMVLTAVFRDRMRVSNAPEPR